MPLFEATRCKVADDVSRLLQIGPVKLDDRCERQAVQDSVDRLVRYGGDEDAFDGMFPYYVQSRVVDVAAAMATDMPSPARSWRLAGSWLDEVWQNADFVLERAESRLADGFEMTLADMELWWQEADARSLRGVPDVEAALESRLVILRAERRWATRQAIAGAVAELAGW
ncbi:hypothetical protein B0I29_123156 [Actinoplanes lutulentus]|uniref:Uncharacterized protein n=2 Tax=Actinoplanes lutulentus TaxID=1287878 RepID=A0A327Z094_9ACTN|nr:hypothetical protein B0I29_123156 [Actinoplanes lutulentus]